MTKYGLNLKGSSQKKNKTENTKAGDVDLFLEPDLLYFGVFLSFYIYHRQVSRKMQMFPYNPIKHNSVMQQHLQVVCVQMCLVTDHYRGPCVCARTHACVNLLCIK